MRHKRKYRKLNRPTDQRLQLLTDISVAVFTRDKIKTTVPRAKEARRWVAKFVALARTGTVASKRKLYAYVKDRAIVKANCEKSLQRFEGRTSGFTRIVRVGKRRGDGVELASFELV